MQIPYSRITPEIVKELSEIVGERNVIYGDYGEMEGFSHDEAPGEGYAHMPECVVTPADAGEIARIMRLANARHFPVTPRGEGSGLSGGAVPLSGGVVMLFRRMNKVAEYEPHNMTITVEPGMITNEINAQVRKDGLFYAGYPMSLEMCSIGGNVAENAGGGKAVRYGVTGRYVLGLEVVTAAGDIVQLGGKCVKDVTGYNMVQLMVGSEGTLGIFTRIILKLLPLPGASQDLLACFKNADDAISAVPGIMRGIVPAAIEFMDQFSIRASCKYLHESDPCENAGAVLLITLEGSDEREVERYRDTVGDICLETGAMDILVADTLARSEKLWRIRKFVTEAYKSLTPHLSVEDIVVPLSRMTDVIKGLKELEEKYDIIIPCCGHAGDGNFHANPMKNVSWSVEEWHRNLDAILTDMYLRVRNLGGTISGEHGIGHKRKKYLPLVCEEAHIEMMRSIKRSLDPGNVLNPGKIFDL